MPRANIELLVTGPKGVFLTLRDIEPCKGLWHLPGGTIYFGESLLEAAARLAKREMGIKIHDPKMVGYIEYPSHYKNGLDHPLGFVFQVTQFDGDLNTNKEAKNGDWFKKLPSNMHPDQDSYLVDNGYATK